MTPLRLGPSAGSGRRSEQAARRPASPIPTGTGRRCFHFKGAGPRASLAAKCDYLATASVAYNAPVRTPSSPKAARTSRAIIAGCQTIQDKEHQSRFQKSLVARRDMSISPPPAAHRTEMRLQLVLILSFSLTFVRDRVSLLFAQHSRILVERLK